MKDIAVPHGTPARHLIQINRTEYSFTAQKGQCEETFVPADCAEKRDTVMLLFVASTLDSLWCPLSTNANY